MNIHPSFLVCFVAHCQYQYIFAFLKFTYRTFFPYVFSNISLLPKDWSIGWVVSHVMTMSHVTITCPRLFTVATNPRIKPRKK